MEDFLPLSVFGIGVILKFSPVTRASSRPMAAVTNGSSYSNVQFCLWSKNLGAAESHGLVSVSSGFRFTNGVRPQ